MSRLRIKICGVTTLDDVRLAVDAGADAVGFNFYPRSPRYVEPRSAVALLRALPPLVDAVGVFVDMPLRQVCALAYQLGLGSIQCLANSTEAGDATPFRQIAAFRVKDRGSIQAINEFLHLSAQKGHSPAAVLVDAHVDGQFGGTGQTAPWDLLADFRPGVPVILAGGLTAANVAQAVRTVRPFAVDVASGVEMAPGRKDPDKLRRFIDAARNAL